MDDSSFAANPRGRKWRIPCWGIHMRKCEVKTCSSKLCSRLDSLRGQFLNRSPTLIPSLVACTPGDPTRPRRENYPVWPAGEVCTVVGVLCLLLALTPTATEVCGRSRCSEGFNCNAEVYGSGMQTFDTPVGAQEIPFELQLVPWKMRLEMLNQMVIEILNGGEI